MTLGTSPKIIPAIIAALAGAVVTVIGALNGDGTTLAAGIGILGTGGFSAAAGYVAKPGEVVVDMGEPNDDLLAAEVGEPVEPPRA